MARSDADLVHAFLPAVAAYVALGGPFLSCKSPRFYRLDRVIFGKNQRLLFRWFSRCFDELIVNSASASAVALSAGFPANHTSLIPNGHALEPFEKPLDRDRLRNAIGVAPADPMLVTVGRLIDKIASAMRSRPPPTCRANGPLSW